MSPRLPPDVTSFNTENSAGDDNLTSEVQVEDAGKQDDGDVSPFQNPVIDDLEDVISLDCTYKMPDHVCIQSRL